VNGYPFSILLELISDFQGHPELLISLSHTLDSDAERSCQDPISLRATDPTYSWP